MILDLYVPFLNLSTSESLLEVDKASTVKTSESTNWNQLTFVFNLKSINKKAVGNCD